jgi:hypothetical protein
MSVLFILMTFTFLLVMANVAGQRWGDPRAAVETPEEADA